MTTPTLEQLQALPPEYLAEDSSKKLIDTSIAFIVVPTFIFMLFCASRTLHNKKDPWDVWILVSFSWACVVALSLVGIFTVTIGGAGRHIEYYMLNDPPQIKKYLKFQTATEFLYCVSTTVPKLAILNLYLKIFNDSLVRKLTWAVIIAIFLQWISMGVVVWATICRPLAFKWDKSIDGHCSDLLAAYRYNSIPNVLTDLAILLIPIKTVRNLHVPKAQKIGIFSLFQLLTNNLRGIVAAIIRFVGFFNVELLTDPTYLCIETVLLTIVEPGAYFICCCLPYIRPLAYNVYQKTGLSAVIGRSTDPASKPSFVHDPSHTGYSANSGKVSTAGVCADRQAVVGGAVVPCPRSKPNGFVS
ncbi:hypothetical protein K469DRAFT_677757 [Zopfia rhizophila CBS 207.26]|uniref:Rhodopsin domain-containing protein n=1 Tax=Zopfia rhizophila CBS 207.26 TaxID=1314779 RepID=A0A6A6DBY7_9PEZI|nr:hypothetical protein K469DRAFT_677757 [Zopfia rhizophila CBS 207.26]